MCDLAKELRGVPFFLKRIGIVGCSYNVDILRDQFPFLSLTLRSDQVASDNNGCSGTEPLHRWIIQQRVSGNDLKIAKRRSVIEFDK